MKSYADEKKPNYFVPFQFQFSYISDNIDIDSDTSSQAKLPNLYTKRNQFLLHLLHTKYHSDNGYNCSNIFWDFVSYNNNSHKTEGWGFFLKKIHLSVGPSGSAIAAQSGGGTVCTTDFVTVIFQEILFDLI